MVTLNIANCIECGKVFRPTAGRRMCPECLKIDREQFERVKQYLRSNPGAGISAISEGTGVSIRRIQEYLREGRLVLAATDEWLRCERCGEPLSTGRLCTRCSREMRRGIVDPVPQPKAAVEPPPSGFEERRNLSPYRGTGKKVVRDKFRRRYE